jgi:hypothetical protein
MPGPYYVIGHATSVANASTVVITAAATTNPGDAVVVGCSTSSGSDTITGVTDSQMNSYISAVANSTEFTDAIYVALNTTPLASGVDTITVTYSAADTSGKNAGAVGCMNIPASAVADVNTSAANAGSVAPSVSSGTLSKANEFLVAWVDSGSGSGAITWANPMIQQIPGFQATGDQWSSMAVLLVSSTNAITAAGSIVSAKWAMLLISLELPPTILYSMKSFP